MYTSRQRLPPPPPSPCRVVACAVVVCLLLSVANADTTKFRWSPISGVPSSSAASSCQPQLFAEMAADAAWSGQSYSLAAASAFGVRYCLQSNIHDDAFRLSPDFLAACAQTSSSSDGATQTNQCQRSQGDTTSGGSVDAIAWFQNSTPLLVSTSCVGGVGQTSPQCSGVCRVGANDETQLSLFTKIPVQKYVAQQVFTGRVSVENLYAELQQHGPLATTLRSCQPYANWTLPEHHQPLDVSVGANIALGLSSDHCDVHDAIFTYSAVLVGWEIGVGGRDYWAIQFAWSSQVWYAEMNTWNGVSQNAYGLWLDAAQRPQQPSPSPPPLCSDQPTQLSVDAPLAVALRERLQTAYSSTLQGRSVVVALRDSVTLQGQKFRTMATLRIDNQPQRVVDVGGWWLNSSTPFQFKFDSLL